MALNQNQSSNETKAPENVAEFNFATPEPRNNRMNWEVKDFEATEITGLDVRETKNAKRQRIYALIELKDNDTPIAVMVEQLLSDQAKGSVPFIISEPGEELKFDGDVQIGCSNSVFFFIK